MTSILASLRPWKFLEFNAGARRPWLFILSICDLWSVPTFFLVEFLAVGLSSYGVFSFMLSSARSSDPSGILFFLLDHNWLSICGFSLFCFLISFALKMEELIWFVLGILVYPALISHALVITGILAARLGVWARYIVQFRRAPIAKDFRLRAGIVFFLWLCASFFAPAIPRVLEETLGVTGLNAITRLLETALLILAFGVTDTFVSMFTFHFYYRRTKVLPAETTRP